jgi:hypothetical protein
MSFLQVWNGQVERGRRRRKVVRTPERGEIKAEGDVFLFFDEKNVLIDPKF